MKGDKQKFSKVLGEFKKDKQIMNQMKQMISKSREDINKNPVKLKKEPMNAKLRKNESPQKKFPNRNARD